jgi:hypothetical protein
MNLKTAIRAQWLPSLATMPAMKPSGFLATLGRCWSSRGEGGKHTMTSPAILTRASCLASYYFGGRAAVFRQRGVFKERVLSRTP